MADPTAGKNPAHQAYPEGTKVAVDMPAVQAQDQAPAPSQTGWLPELKKIYTIPAGIQRGSAFHRAIQPALNGEAFVQPSSWPTWTLEEQAKYLDEKYPKGKAVK